MRRMWMKKEIVIHILRVFLLSLQGIFIFSRLSCSHFFRPLCCFRLLISILSWPFRDFVMALCVIFNPVKTPVLLHQKTRTYV